MTPDAVIAANLKRLRRESSPKLSQQHLAVRMGEIDGGSTDRSRVAKIERGLVAVTWRDILVAAIALEVSVRQIVIPPDDEKMVLATRYEASDYFGGALVAGAPYLVDRQGAWDFISSPSDEWRQLRQELALTRAEMIRTVEDLRQQREELRRTRVVADATTLSDPPPPPPVTVLQVPVDQIEEDADGIDS